MQRWQGTVSSIQRVPRCQELNLISLNGLEPKYDILDWASNHEKRIKELLLAI